VLGECYIHSCAKLCMAFCGVLIGLTIWNRDEAKLLTKGDNNVADDTELYARGQDYLERKDIIGSVVAYIPFVGYVTILLSEHPWLKTVMLGIMGLVVVLQRE
jgi:signal peptidase